MYTNISRLLTEIFDLALNVGPCRISKMKSLGCFVEYPHKLNSAAFASAKVVYCVITMKTVSIV